MSIFYGLFSFFGNTGGYLAGGCNPIEIMVMDLEPTPAKQRYPKPGKLHAHMSRKVHLPPVRKRQAVNRHK